MKMVAIYRHCDGLTLQRPGADQSLCKSLVYIQEERRDCFRYTHGDSALLCDS